jgi:deoxyadenosine/deoxycytidine kinase
MLPILEAQDRPLLLLVEGLIGSGKSTATLSIAEVMGLIPLLEPVNTNPYLGDFYKAVQAGGTKARIQEVLEKWAPTGQGHAEFGAKVMADALESEGLTNSLVPAFMQLHLLTKRFSLYQAAVHGMPVAKALGHPANGAVLDRSLPGDRRAA